MLTAVHGYVWLKAVYVRPTAGETSLVLFPPSCRKKQCSVLLELLKKFQSCRSHLSNTMQKAEQTVSDQASYLGKDNLQRTITKVSPQNQPRSLAEFPQVLLIRFTYNKSVWTHKVQVKGSFVVILQHTNAVVVPLCYTKNSSNKINFDYV